MGACMAAQCGPWADLEVNTLRDISIISNQSFVRKRAPQRLKNPHVEAVAGPRGFLAQEFLLIDSWYWDEESDRGVHLPARRDKYREMGRRQSEKNWNDIEAAA